jgi:hypothetical protein
MTAAGGRGIAVTEAAGSGIVVAAGGGIAVNDAERLCNVLIVTGRWNLATLTFDPNFSAGQQTKS